MPFRWETALWGSRAVVLYSVIFPVAGSSFPRVALLFPVYQMFPFESGTIVWGRAVCGSGYSFIWPVLGSSRPTRLAYIPVHQTEPSGASIGSRERWPRVGTIHSEILMLKSPGTSVGRRSVFSGKVAARYPLTLSAWSLGKATIVPTNAAQPSLVYPAELVIWFNA